MRSSLSLVRAVVPGLNEVVLMSSFLGVRARHRKSGSRQLGTPDGCSDCALSLAAIVLSSGQAVVVRCKPGGGVTCSQGESAAVLASTLYHALQDLASVQDVGVHSSVTHPAKHATLPNALICRAITAEKHKESSPRVHNESHDLDMCAQ